MKELKTIRNVLTIIQPVNVIINHTKDFQAAMLESKPNIITRRLVFSVAAESALECHQCHVRRTFQEFQNIMLHQPSVLHNA